MEFKTPKDFAIELANNLPKDLGENLPFEVDEAIQNDARDIVTTIVQIVTVGKLVWEISKFVWIKTQSLDHKSTEDLKVETKARFYQQKIVTVDTLVDIITKAVDLLKR